MVLEVPEKRLALIHRVVVPDRACPKEYAVMVTDRRSIFIRQMKTRRTFVLRQEMRFGTALVTDVPMKTLPDYDQTSLEVLTSDTANITIPHNSIGSFSMSTNLPEHRRRDFFVWMVMKMQKEIFQVYNFQIKHERTSGRQMAIRFYAVPLGTYFKTKRQTQTRETILREYAMDILRLYRSVLPGNVVSS